MVSYHHIIFHLSIKNRNKNPNQLGRTRSLAKQWNLHFFFIMWVGFYPVFLCFCVCVRKISQELIHVIIYNGAHVTVITIVISTPFRHTLVVAYGTSLWTYHFTIIVILLQPRVIKNIFTRDSLIGISTQ